MNKKKILKGSAILFGFLLFTVTGPGYFIYQSYFRSNSENNPQEILQELAVAGSIKAKI